MAVSASDATDAADGRTEAAKAALTRESVIHCPPGRKSQACPPPKMYPLHFWVESDWDTLRIFCQQINMPLI